MLNTAASVVQAFQDDYEVAALDLRGYGKSDKPRVGVLRRVYHVQPPSATTKCNSLSHGLRGSMPFL